MQLLFCFSLFIRHHHHRVAIKCKNENISICQVSPITVLLPIVATLNVVQVFIKEHCMVIKTLHISIPMRFNYIVLRIESNST